MVNFMISINIFFLIFLIYFEKIHCQTENTIKNNEFLKIFNSSDLSKSIFLQNKAAFLLEKNQINLKKLNYLNSNEINQKLLDSTSEPLNLRNTLNKNFIESENSEMDYLSFIETSTNVKESEFSFHTEPFTWTNLTTFGTKPSPRKDFSMVLADSFLIVFGGCTNNNDFYNDLFFFDISGQTWIKIKQNGKIPSARCGHSAKLYGSIMWMFGGYSREGYLNDIYSLNLETREWKQHYFSGEIPIARSGHEAVVDDNAKLFIFGGYSSEGYLNDLLTIDTINEKIEKITVTGKLPSPRENFAMILINKRIFLFGGFQQGGALNDLFSIDLISFTWDQFKPEGPTPSLREGMGVERFGKKIIFSGGCNHRLHSCYADSYILDTETMWWTKIENDYKFVEKSGFKLIFFRGNILLFGGCPINGNCTNNIISLNVDEICPNNCSENGVCKEIIGCICKTGFISNDCSITIKCKNECSNNGVCHNNGKCACFPGWGGVTCENKINCSKNCTSFDNGICQMNGKCLCKEGFEGEDCSSFKLLKNGKELKKDSVISMLSIKTRDETKDELVEEKLSNVNFMQLSDEKENEVKNKIKIKGNKCSDHGKYDIKSKKCDCNEKFSGEDCSIVKNQTLINNSNNKIIVKNDEKKIYTNKQNSNSDNSEKRTDKKIKVSPLKESEKSKNSINEKQISANRIKPKKGKNKKPGDDEESDNSDSKDDEDESAKPKFYMIDGVKYTPTQDCPNDCNKKGICLNKVCLCEQNYTTEDCSYTYDEFKNQGFKFEDITMLLVVVIIVSMIITLINKIISKSNKKFEDHLNLE